MKRTAAVLSFAFVGLGIGPFVWHHRDVEAAREHILVGRYADAVTALKGVDIDAPEVHLARAVGVFAQEKPDLAADATTSLDQSYRLVAEQAAVLAGQDPETRARRVALGDLRARVAFGRGLVAAQKQDWAAAVGEFRRVLELNPADEDARWNLEVAYFKQNPPCRLRDDDHEPDSTPGDAKPFDPQKAQKRVLCAADEDWYALELPAGALVQVQVKGKVTPTEDDDDTREAVLSLYAPSEPAAPHKQVPLTGGSGTLTVKRLPESGTWRFALAGPGRAEIGYDVTVTAVPPCAPAPGPDEPTPPPGTPNPGDDDAEENDTLESATPVQDGERPGLKACPGDPDYFVVTVPKDEGRSVLVKHTPEDGPLSAELVGLDGSPLSVPGPALSIPPAAEEQKVLVRVYATTDAENLYALEVKKPDGGDNQDNQDQQDKQDKPKPDEPSDDQNDQQPPPKPQNTNQVDPQKLIDELDKNEQNPQLQKLLKNLSAVPQMEDY